MLINLYGFNAITPNFITILHSITQGWNKKIIWEEISLTGGIKVLMAGFSHFWLTLHRAFHFIWPTTESGFLLAVPRMIACLQAIDASDISYQICMQNDPVQIAVLAYQKALTKIKPLTSTALKSALVALYTADPQGKLRYSRLIGLLQIDIDRQAKSRFLRIYDVETLSLAFQVEIYYGFQKFYRALTDTLYMFEYPKGSIAFQFRNPTEAELMKMKILSNCPSLEEYEQVRQRNLEAARRKQEENSFFGRIKNFFGSEKPEQQQESEILSFKKNTSISFNLADGTFNTENVPPEWQEVFSALQLSKEDLNNKDVMGMIVEETILNQAKRQAEQESNKDLQRKVQMAEQDIKKEHTEYQEDVRRNTTLNLPPPPPPPPPLLTPPNMRNSLSNNRSNLMDEIRNNNLRLKHVEVNSKEGKDQVTLDISDMNKDERNDHIENLRKKLQMRKKALNRREDDDD